MNNLKTHIDASASKEKLEFKKSQKNLNLNKLTTTKDYDLHILKASYF